MNETPLGKSTVYKAEYDKNLLFPIKRSDNRSKDKIDSSIFKGYDIWNCYEFSYLNIKGKPQNRLLRIVYGAHSGYMVESKSLKLYLVGFSMSVFTSDDEVKRVIENDLKELLVTGFLYIVLSDITGNFDYTDLSDYTLIDHIDITTDIYMPDKSLLSTVDNINKQENDKLISHILKTNCPITRQPDWASVLIDYKGSRMLNKEGLLKYLVSFRNHWGYHESCCEIIFTDLFDILQPETLVVKTLFTRRGGIDINPCRFYGIEQDDDYSLRTLRQ